MRSVRWIAALSAVLLAEAVGSAAAAQVSRDPPPGQSRPAPATDLRALAAAASADAKSLTEANAFLTCDLRRELGAQPGNLVFSPYSVATALAIARAGASGRTAQEMASAMHWTLPADRLAAAEARRARWLNSSVVPGDTLLSANRLWVQRGDRLLPAYEAIVSRRYGPIGVADFAGQPAQAAREINAWASDLTCGYIPGIIDESSLKATISLLLVNALYLRARWAAQFAASSTRPAPFHLASRDSTQVPTMHHVEDHGYAERASVRILELAYLRHELSFVVLLPTTQDGLPRLEASLTADSLRVWLGALQNRSVDVSLPKFRVASDLNMNEPLQALGIHDAFDPTAADFSRMSEDQLWISRVLHKAIVEVDENGSRAAASSAVEMTKGIALPGAPIVFRADHPFLFLIRDAENGTILFFGRVADPRG